MSHPYDKTANCECTRCVKERTRRAAQSAANAQPKPVRYRAPRERVASREEQHARYIDCGPQAWDDR